jgi:anti-sigma factor RsiW
MTEPTFRDVEQLSAYLDGKLPETDSARLQSRLAADPEIARLYQELSQTRSMLRRIPKRRAPRNFTLSAEKAGVRPPLPRTYPLLQFASGLAGMLFFLSLLGSYVARPASQPEAAMLVAEAPATEAPTEFVSGAPVGTATSETPFDTNPVEPPSADRSMEQQADAEAPVQSWQALLFGLSVVLGGLALFVRWRTDRNFRHKARGRQAKS